jgi:hypothetical protein
MDALKEPGMKKLHQDLADACRGGPRIGSKLRVNVAAPHILSPAIQEDLEDLLLSFRAAVRETNLHLFFSERVRSQIQGSDQPMDL